MRLTHISAASVLAISMAVSAGADTPAVDFSRYQSILDRKPFGEEAVAKQPTGPVVPPAPIEPPFWKDLRLCGITDRESGTRVAFVNIAAKPPKTYFLTVGGEPSEDGIVALEADFAGERAKLHKGDQDAWLSMTAATTTPGPGTPAGQPQMPTPPPGMMSGSLSPRITMPAPSVSPSLATTLDAGATAIAPAKPAPTATPEQMRQSYAERLKSRREALRVKQVEAPKLTGEDLQKHLEQYQMDLIRKGAPPLPMPLTKDMDDQLVKEGVLAPQDAAATPAAPAQ